MLKSLYNLSRDYIEGEETGDVAEEGAGGEEGGTRGAAPPARRLHREEAGVRLEMLGKTADGDSYAYLKIVCTDMKLTDISVIPCFNHLLFVNVSNNNLTLEGLQVLTTMPFLILIHADKNVITSAALKRMEYLQVIIMNNNYIDTCRNIYQPEMTTIELGYNKISKIEFENDMPELRCLDLRYNMIKEISGIKFAKLESLYLAGNKIKKLNGLEMLHNLKVLHLRNNPIKKLDGFSSHLKKLIYVNLRNCYIASRKQVKKLKVLPSMTVLVLKGTPYMGGAGGEDQDAEEDTEQRTEILATLPSLQRINKAVITTDEREEAMEILKNWIEEPNEEDEEEEDEEEEEEEDILREEEDEEKKE